MIRFILPAALLATSAGAAQASSFTLDHTVIDTPPEAGAFFGYSVDVSGTTAVVGAFLDDSGARNAGTAYVVNTATGAVTQALSNPSLNDSDYFGWSVAVDGTTAIIGARVDDPGGVTNAGAAYLYDTGTGALLQTLTAPTPNIRDEFAWSVDISGSTAIVGARLDDPGGVIDAGAAYLYDTGTGTLLQTLTAPTPGTSEEFGWSVAVDGTTAIVGARFADPGGVTNAGAAYLYDTTTGTLLHTLTVPTPGTNDQFGWGVDVSGTLAVVGATFDDDAGADTGAVHVFDVTTGTLLHTLTSPTPDSGDRFGSSVAIDGGRIVVGALLDDTGATDAGAVYIFDAATGAFLQALANPAPSTSDRFGGDLTGVGISGNTVIVGAHLDDSAGATNAGAAYIYTDQTAVIPLPAALPLLLAGLGGLALIRARRRPCA